MIDRGNRGAKTRRRLSVVRRQRRNEGEKKSGYQIDMTLKFLLVLMVFSLPLTRRYTMDNESEKMIYEKIVFVLIADEICIEWDEPG